MVASGRRDRIYVAASQTAIAHLKVALAHVATASNIATEEATADLTRLYGPQLSAVKGNASREVLSVYEQRSIAHGLANSAHLPHRFDSLWGIQTCFLVRGELDKACHNGAQLTACAFAIGATEHRILALRLHALLEFLFGNLDRARDHYLSVLSLHDPDRHAPLRHTYASDQAALAHAHLAWTYALLDDEPSSQAAARQALARAEHLTHPHTHAHTLCVIAAAHLNMRQLDKSAPLAMAARAIAQRHDFLYWCCLVAAHSGDRGTAATECSK